MKYFIPILIFSTLIVSCNNEFDPEQMYKHENVQDLNVEKNPNVIFWEWEKDHSVTTRSGSKIYPDWFGGCYADNGVLIMLCKNTNRDIILPVGTKRQICDYSFNELDSINAIITDRLVSTNYNDLNNIFGYGILNDVNRIGIILYKDDKSSIQNFKTKIIDDPRIKYLGIDSLLSINTQQNYSSSNDILKDNIEDVRKHAESKSIYLIKCGATLQKPNSKGAASLGYRVIDKSGNEGIISAGHFFKIGDTVLSVRGDTIGSCENSISGNLLDAAFCKITNPGYKITNTISGYGTDTLSTEVRQPILKAHIFNSGYNGPLKGTVINPSFNLVEKSNSGKEVIYPDVILMSMQLLGGNSGGPVFAKGLFDGLNYTVGIMMGNYQWRENPQQVPIPCSVCIKAYRINSYFSVERY